MKRWLWFGIAVLTILQTPDAVMSAIHLVKSDHRLGWIVPVAFAIRFGTIWLFLKLWWRSRPSKETSVSN
jgi:hypothetical protein